MRDSSVGKMIDDEECMEIVRKKLRDDDDSSISKDFNLVDYEMIPIGEVNGFMGRYLTLKTTISFRNNTTAQRHDNRIYNFFTKIPPPVASPQYDWIQEYGSFKKEVDLYTIVFPKVLGNLEKGTIPECYFGHDNDIIVLEDMAQSGYSMTDKLISFDLEHCQIVMRTLAKFHAKSIIFEELERKNLYDEFSRCMQETLWPLSEGRSKRMFEAAVKGVVSVVDLVERLDYDERCELKKIIESRSLDHAKKLSPSVVHRNVICHGDLWANNILFRYDENGKPEACCLIDFQLARYNPPAHDILCFLHFTTTPKFRKSHGENLFKIYWDCMAESLSDAGLVPTVIFPWIKFIDSLNVLRSMSMTHGILNIPIMLLEPSTASKYFAEQPELLESLLYVDRTPLIFEQFHRVSQYRKRMLEALLELYESKKL